MAWIAGVDGCPGGWIVVYADPELENLECCVHEKFKDVMARPDLVAVAVDMPIGLWDKGRRDCDDAARDILGKRHSSIFSAPAASLFSKMADELGERSAHKRASECNRKLTGTGLQEGKGLSIQSWSLAPKIADVRDFVLDHPEKQRCVHEVHPEVSFAAMNAQHGGEPPFDPMRHSKTKAAGRNERCELLNKIFGAHVKRLEAKRRQLPKIVTRRASLDDLYDALACLWTAQRVHRFSEGLPGETCRSLPNNAPCDASGLPMRIVY